MVIYAKLNSFLCTLPDSANEIWFVNFAENENANQIFPGADSRLVLVTEEKNLLR
jgi:hypothetical protein